MDLNAIKNRLQSHQQKPQKKEKIDYAKVFWKPKPGKYQIRIVPSKIDKSNPFREIYLHYGLAKFPIFALTNWGEQDPIVDFAKQLRQSRDKDDWALAKKIDPKMRVFIPVVVRGEEAMGTRLWEVGKGIYMDLLGIAADEDYGDFTDIMEGRDFTVEAVKDVVAGREATKCSIRVKPKTSVLSEDKELVTKLLEEQPDILEINERYKHTYESLKEVLQKWLHPGEESEAPDATPTVAAAAEEEDLNSGNDLPWETAAAEAPAKVSKKDKIDSLFND